jgi:hypothetical protein
MICDILEEVEKVEEGLEERKSLRFFCEDIDFEEKLYERDEEKSKNLKKTLFI